MIVAFVALGSNLAGRFSSPETAVEAAIAALDSEDVQVVARSRLYRSAAWPDPSDPEFVNAVARVETDLSAARLLERLHTIEAEFGRERRQTNAPRTLDLDIVDYGGQVSPPGESPVLPHPRLADRAFVLLPLIEIAPGWRHPATGIAVADLIAVLQGGQTAVPL